MEEIAISKFRATCYGILEQVRKTGKPVMVTRYGEPLVEVEPPPPATRKRTWLGCMSGTGRINGDIVSPVAHEGWQVLET